MAKQSVRNSTVIKRKRGLRAIISRASSKPKVKANVRPSKA